MDNEKIQQYKKYMYDLVLYLSKPYEIQLEEMEDFVRWNLPEEVGLEWDDATGMIDNIRNECILPVEDISILCEIRQNFIDAFQLEERSYLEIWSHEAMKDHPFWTKQRNLAKRVVANME